jgi:hypothetical protein
MPEFKLVFTIDDEDIPEPIIASNNFHAMEHARMFLLNHPQKPSAGHLFLKNGDDYEALCPIDLGLKDDEKPKSD